MRTKCRYVPKFFISSLFTSDSLCPKIQYFGPLSYTNAKLNSEFWQCIALSRSKISDNRNKGAVIKNATDWGGRV